MICTARRASLLVALGVALCAPAAAHAGCDRVASPSGSDTAPGTLGSPYRTAQKLAGALAAGQVGCLRGGTYPGNVTLSRSGVTIIGYIGERAEVLGQVDVPVGANGVTVFNLWLNGRGNISPVVSGDRAIFAYNDVTNDHTSICFHPAAQGHRPTGDVIEFNRIHDCGQLPATNHHHGIYVLNADRLVIRNNWIYRNADRGVQLYPDAQGTVITGNVIDSNGEGIIFGGDFGTASSDTTVRGNVITNSTIRRDVESSYPAGNPVGTGNVVAGNCIHGGGIGAQIGFTATDNLDVAPGFVDAAAGDYRLQSSSPCAQLMGVTKSPSGGQPGPARSNSEDHWWPVPTRPRRVTLHAKTRSRRRLLLTGRVTGRPGRRWRVLLRATGGHRWKTVRTSHVTRRGTFRVRWRVQGRRRITVRIRAVVPGVGQSRTLRRTVRRARKF